MPPLSPIDRLRTVQAEIVIAAPQQIIWDILVDLEQYAAWNPFTFWMQPPLLVGETFRGKVKMRENWIIEQNFRVRAVEAPRLIAWGGDEYPSWLLFPTRYQVLTPISATSTRYETWETFKGLLSFVTMTQAPPVRHGFESVCAALKVHAESLYREGNSAP